MKQTAYNYSVSGNSVTLTGVNVPLNQILLVSDATSGNILYSIAGPSATSYTQGSNSVITLATAPGTDKLYIAYDDGVSETNAPTTVAVSNFPSAPTSINVSNFPTSTEISNDSGNPIPVSGTVAVSNFPTTQAVSGTVTVANPTTSVSVSNLPSTQAVSGTVTVSNPQTSVSITGTPTVTSNIGTTGGLALDSTAQSILAAIQATVDLSTTVWADNTVTPPVYYIRRETDKSGTITVAWETPSGSAATPTVSNLVAISAVQGIVTESNSYTATSSGTGYSTGDVLFHTFGVDTATSPASLAFSFWFNAGPSSTGILSSAPSNGTYSATTQGVSAASLPLPSGAATSANQTTGNTSLATIATNTTGVATAANQTTGNTSLATIATNTTGVATAANQTTGNTSLATIATNTNAGSAITGQTLPSGSGILGWLSNIYNKLTGSIAVTGTFWQTTQPVSIATMPSTPVTGTFWQTTQPVSGTVTVSNPQTSVSITGTPTVSVSGTVPVSGTFYQATQPVSGTITSKVQDGSGNALTSTTVTGGHQALDVNIVAGGGSGGGGGGAVTIADGAAVTVGSLADSAYSGSGSSSLVSVLKGIYNALVAPLPSGSNTIGSVSVSNFPSTQSVSVLSLIHI